MMMPPEIERGRANAARSTRTADPRSALELELAGVRREISAIGAALKNPLAWISLEILAIATDRPGPLERLRALWFSEALLEASLSWHQARELEPADQDERIRVTFSAIVYGDRWVFKVLACETLAQVLRPAMARHPLVRDWVITDELGQMLEAALDVGTLELDGSTIYVSPRPGAGG